MTTTFQPSTMDFSFLWQSTKNHSQIHELRVKDLKHKNA